MPSFVYDVNTQKIQPVDEQISWGKIGGTFIASAAGYYTQEQAMMAGMQLPAGQYLGKTFRRGLLKGKKTPMQLINKMFASTKLGNGAFKEVFPRLDISWWHMDSTQLAFGELYRQSIQTMIKDGSGDYIMKKGIKALVKNTQTLAKKQGIRKALGATLFTAANAIQAPYLQVQRQDLITLPVMQAVGSVKMMQSQQRQQERIQYYKRLQQLTNTAPVGRAQEYIDYSKAEEQLILRGIQKQQYTKMLLNDTGVIWQNPYQSYYFH